MMKRVDKVKVFQSTPEDAEDLEDEINAFLEEGVREAVSIESLLAVDEGTLVMIMVVHYREPRPFEPKEKGERG